MIIDIKKLQSVLDKGDYDSEVSVEAKNALDTSIKIRHKYTKHTKSENDGFLDFTRINEISIAKRGNLKVYQNLPKGIRVVAR